ncbi:MAG: glucans biosynthesis glucosyltransferase MdoH [Acidiferrobacter sp.]
MTRVGPTRRPSILWRGALLAILVLIPSVIASQFMLEVLPHPGFDLLNDGLATVFGFLFGWISIGLWISLAGALLLLFAPRSRLQRQAQTAPVSIREARTALVMPVFQEDPVQVCARIEAIYRSVAQTGRLAQFDFFILSDSNDADAWVEEEVAWAALRARLGADARIFYRRRRNNIKRKSGNIADFCRRWGRLYRYMVILDADSLMSGTVLTRLVVLMEGNPAVGLIQTLPAAIHQNTLFGRVQQFASRLYGPVFAAGLHFWHVSEGHYWGHNAIIRVAPFVGHCALPRLPGSGAFGGEIMSHDFVEAALLRRAGWEVWMEPGLEGSYEETPPTLLDELKRDRRWAQGNMQHARLVFARGIVSPHRVVFLNGIMSYVSSLLWLAFLALSGVEAVLHALVPPQYFPRTRVLFPVWPVWHPEWAVVLFWFTLAILFVPKVLAIILVVIRGRTAAYGGGLRLLTSVVLESVLSSILAPVRMLFHTVFVVSVLAGRKTQWGPQARGDASTTWRQALRYHSAGTLLAIVWGGLIYLLSPNYFWWLLPVMAAWLVAIPVSVWISRVRPGVAARKMGLFLTPEEIEPPPLLRLFAEACLAPTLRRCTKARGFLAAIVDPGVNALHCALLRPSGTVNEGVSLSRQQLMLMAIKDGPRALSAHDRLRVLSDRESVMALHWRVWALKGRRAQHWLDGSLLRTGKPAVPSPCVQVSQ